MSFARARAVADAILFEGYALYPYRPSSRKNMLRWQFGVIAPRRWAEDEGGESWWMETQCLVELQERSTAPQEDNAGEPAPSPALIAKLRFLRLRQRRVLAPSPVESIDVDGRLLVAWDEGEPHEIEVTRGLGEAGQHRFELSGDAEEEAVARADGTLGARVEMRRSRIAGCVDVSWEPVAAARPCVRLRLRVDNRTELGAGASRQDAMASSLLGAHVLLAVAGGDFVSLIDPPGWAEAAASACKNVRAFPVLAGEAGTRGVVLASPIILYDYPGVAPESPGDLFDATEIDEILTLRTRALTDSEKREACAADRRVAALIARTDSLSDAALGRLHGQWRTGDPLGEGQVAVQPSEARDRACAEFTAGDRIRLRPGSRPSDAQDMFLDGRTATVRLVMRDVEGRVCLAVTVDEDPAAELCAAAGRFHYFYIDEIERADALGTVTSS
jgi:hypothetical protein